ncbi:MAG TPA: glycoside hydrolase family 15 protein, partial [Pirellulales bacterium]|nr:glycoside hydrolase family 15 protein [Pirellulales bacterium]
MTTNPPRLSDYVRERYTAADIDRLTAMLTAQGTFVFPRLENGLFRAAATEGAEGDITGYANVWVRDNIYIAHAHWLLGQSQIAVANVQALMRYFARHRHRFDDVIAGRADYTDPMQRPHIRFKGDDLSELAQKWAHAQNDALGYFMWLFSRLAVEGDLQASREDLELLMTLVRYFERIEFWHDEDSGHWEEARKVSASSIGVATAGLTEFAELLAERCESRSGDVTELETWAKAVITLADRGRRAMNAILPAECAQDDPTKLRRYDAALLFL